jgi:hypothetical protein
MANISIFEIYQYIDGVAINSQTHGFSFIQFNPRSVTIYKSVLSNGGLSLCRIRLPVRFIYGFACSFESLKQNVKACGGYADRKERNDNSKNANNGLPGPILPLLGAMMMIVGVTLCWRSIAQRRVCGLIFGWAVESVGTTLLAIGVGNYVTPLW